MNQLFAWSAGAALLVVLALILSPRATTDKPYVDEDGVLVPCGCGCTQ